MSLLDQVLLFLVSWLANLFSAFAGGGAGLIQLPALIFLGLPFGIALATHKLASIFLGIGATVRNLKSHKLHPRLVLTMICFGVPGVVVGANIILNIPEKSAELALGMLTLGLGLYSVFKKDFGQEFRQIDASLTHLMIGGSVLFGIGILNGSLTSGTGLFVTIWLIRWFGLDYKTAVAYTLVLVGLFWNGSGALTLGLLGQIAWDWLPALILGSLLGGYMGAHFAIVKGNKWIKRSFEIITMVIGVKLISGSL